MARIAGINLPGTKPIWIALTSIYGVGPTVAKDTLKQAKIDPGIRTQDIAEADIDRIRVIVEKNFTIEGELRMQVTQNIKRLKEIGTYRGSRHAKKLPARGQRTKTNARTKRGKRVTVGSGRKATGLKT